MEKTVKVIIKKVLKKRPIILKEKNKGNSLEKITYNQDCFECNEPGSLFVSAFLDNETMEVVKFDYQECSNCGWNQYS
tara:strand:- start:488 stop:721 length:234 start_codon:yes stop_codon:yes gene_type:complete